jgi:hypothetical protein
VLLHAIADETVALDRDLVVPEVADERVAQEEGGRVIVDLPRRKEKRPGSVYREHPPGQEAGVVGKEAHRRTRDVSALV